MLPVGRETVAEAVETWGSAWCFRESIIWCKWLVEERFEGVVRWGEMTGCFDYVTTVWPSINW
jgi:hypothetical protein